MATPEKIIPLANPGASIRRIGIARGRFNSHLTDQQLASAARCLEEYGIAYDVIAVAGSFELIYALQQMAASNKYDGLVALGCLIKGDTPHFEYIAEAVTRGIADLTLAYKIPIGFGIITALTEQQAQDRVQLGYDWTHAVLESLTTARNPRQ